jgi:hypothetical protein
MIKTCEFYHFIYLTRARCTFSVNRKIFIASHLKYNIFILHLRIWVEKMAEVQSTTQNFDSGRNDKIDQILTSVNIF